MWRKLIGHDQQDVWSCHPQTLTKFERSFKFVDRVACAVRRDAKRPGQHLAAGRQSRYLSPRVMMGIGEYVWLVDVDRFRFLFGSDALEHLDEYDLDEEVDRMEVVERFAALPVAAPQREARMAMRTVAVTQILTDDPPEAWRTAQRLRGLGLDRDAVLSQMSLVVAQHLSSALSSQSLFDTGAYVEALEALPLPEASDIAERAVRIARDRPGISVEEHIDAVVASLGSGGVVVEELVDRVVDDLVDGPLYWLPGDRTVVVPDLLAGKVFTHRFNEVEAELGLLSVAFDLGALARIDTVRLSDGTELDQFSVEQHHRGWRGPDGWLDRFEAGDLLGFAVSLENDGTDGELVEATVTITVVPDETAPAREVVEHVRAAYDELVAEPGLPVHGGELAWWLLFHHPTLFDTAQPPLSELCAAAGLDERAGRVAHAEEVWRRDLALQRFRAVFDAVPEAHWRDILGRAVDVLDDPDATAEQVRSVLDECAEPEALDVLADVLFAHWLDESDEFERGQADAPGRLFELVERAAAAARRPRETAVAQYLACVLHERCGAPETAEVHLQRAGKAQPQLGPVVERLGWYCFDRGDARGAMRWWRTLTDIPDAARTIEPFLTPSNHSHKLGRNDPCWCGSGRKFKRCHQNATELPALPDRVGWLCRKAALWLEHSTGDVRASVVELVSVRATGDPDVELWDMAGVGDDALGDLLESAAADPIVFDAALHEGGLFALFLRERGELLPEDEQILAASWQTTQRSVHEVIAVEPGATITLRDLATGDDAEVRERTASTQVKVGERYCARVVPDGAGHQIIGGTFGVRTGHETTVLDLCAEGDPVALCAWAGALARPPSLVHAPGLADEMFDRDAIEALLSGLGEDTDPDAGMAVLGDELARQAQTRWLDEHVPALGGLTPRQAAADPTRREQLERLLAEFDDRKTPGLPDGFKAFSYDVASLRHELGLD